MLNLDKTAQGDRQLHLGDVLDDLLADGLITRQQADKLRFRAALHDSAATHPLVVIANQNWHSATDVSYPLDLEPRPGRLYHLLLV